MSQNGIYNTSSITQIGSSNQASVSQHWPTDAFIANNLATVTQNGTGNIASVIQQ
ncbi:hypothetical protein ACI2KR_20170 [Pseudomonas luteola]